MFPQILSSGNQYAHLRQLFKDVMADNLIVVAENGRRFMPDRLIFDGSLSADQQRKFVTVDRYQPLFKDAYVILVGSHGSYTELGAPDKLVAMARQFYDHLHLVADLATVDDTVKKISISTSPDQAADLVARANDFFDGELRAHDSGYGVVDLVDQRVGKLPAIQFLATKLGLTAANVMARGDGRMMSHYCDMQRTVDAMCNAPGGHSSSKTRDSPG